MSMLKNRPFVRRRAQLALLTSACDANEPARLVPENTSSASGNGAIDARFVAHDSNGVTFTTEFPQSSDRLAPTTALSVHFGHRGRRYAFRSTVMQVDSLRAGEVAAPLRIRLTRPLALRPGPTRTRERFRIADSAHIPVTLMPLWNGTTTACGELQDISDGGLAVRLPRELAEALTPPMICRASVAVPNRAGSWRFVLRLAHVTATDSEYCRTGWAFVASDDGFELDSRLEQLQHCIEEMTPPSAATAYEA